MFKNLKIAPKLIIGFLVIALLVIIVGYIGLHGVEKIGEAFEEVTEDAVPVAFNLAHLQHEIANIRLETLDYLITGQTKHLDELQESFEEYRARKEDLIKREGQEGGEWTVLIDKLENVESTFKELSNELIALKDQGELAKTDIGQVPQVQEMELLENDLLVILKERIIYEDEELEEQREVVVTETQKTQKRILLSSVLVILLGLGFGFFISYTISKPIKELVKVSKKIGQGDLTLRAKVNTKDEIGQLAESFNEMTEKIRKSHKKINQEKEKFEVLLMSIGDGVFGIDKEQKIVYFNKQAEKISGYKEASVLGKYYYDILKFVKVKDKSENIEFIRKALGGEASDMGNHTVLIRKNKSEVSVADSATPIKDKKGNILGAIVVFRDASKERELDRAKSELVSFAGHQLKAPLTFIAGNVEMLKGGKLDAESRKLADEIALGVNEMKKLVRDVLNISRIEQGEIELKPKPTQLEEVVEDIIKETTSVSEKRKVTIEFAKPTSPLPDIMIDPEYIHEVFKNIISNAIKYTKDSITISFEKKDDNVIFKCTDNGIGIPKDEQSKIFSKFYIASNAAKSETKGTGLGLSIAKALVEKMNGRIWFESEENKGSTFYISLPLL